MILSHSRTLLEDLKCARENGYTEDFIYREQRLIGQRNRKEYSKEDCLLVEYCLHEGMSDPSDQSIIFLIECTDGTKGALSSAYGIYADAELIEFCRSLHKKEEA